MRLRAVLCDAACSSDLHVSRPVTVRMFIPSWRRRVPLRLTQPLVRAKATPIRVFQGKSVEVMSPQAEQLDAQLYSVHKIYGQRLLVLQRTLQDFEDARTYNLAERIRAIASHNEHCVLFLSNGGNYAKLAGQMWDAEYAQQVYEPLIVMLLSDSTLPCVSQIRTDKQHLITAKYNAVVFGNDFRNYFRLEMFPVFMIDHIVHIRKILEAYDRVEYALVREDVTAFIVWLDKQLRPST